MYKELLTMDLSKLDRKLHGFPPAFPGVIMGEPGRREQAEGINVAVGGEKESR